MDAVAVRDVKRHRALGPGERAFAALDLGTNNCRLLVIAAAADGSQRVLDSWSRIVRLGEGLAHTGRLSDAAMDRTEAALAVCARRLRRFPSVEVRAVATAACRQAVNGRDFAARAARTTGLPLRVISEAEEARLAALGCAPLLGAGFDGALVFDIGGGSTELIRLERRGEVVESIFAASVPAGVVTLTEKGVTGEALERELTGIFGAVADAMRAAAGPFAQESHHLLGTSGTVTALAGVALELRRYDRRRVDGSWHDTARLLDVAASLAALPEEERSRIPAVGDKRADLMPAGCAVFAAIVAQWPCSKLRVADRGLREGMLRELMAQHEIPDRF